MPGKQERGITGLILVGGKSRRMGVDKALLEIAGQPLIERVIELFSACFDRTLLAGDQGQRFAGYGLPIVSDLYPGSPLGGIYTGLAAAGTEHVFVASCDLPFPSPAILHHLCSLKDGFDAVVPLAARGYEPLFALYSKRCLGPIKALLDSGDCCAYAYFPEIQARYVLPGELAELDREGLAFFNVNTPEDLERAAKRLADTGGSRTSPPTTPSEGSN
ncbi:MAG: molybdenum cofactor guanylyltransferase [Spirochaetota bacterium]